MNENHETVLSRVYLRNTDQHGLTTAWDHIVQQARKRHLGGATVLHGLMGFGLHGLRRHRWWQVTEDAPIMIQMLESRDVTRGFLRTVAIPALGAGGMIAVRAATVIGGPLERPAKTGAATAGDTTDTIDPNGDHSMNTSRQILVRIFTVESAVYGNEVLYRVVGDKAHAAGLAFMTVFRGILGFGHHGSLRTDQVAALAADLPIVIEIMDTEEKIQAFLPHLAELAPDALTTTETVDVIALAPKA